MNANTFKTLKSYMSEYSVFFKNHGIDLEYLHQTLLVRTPEFRSYKYPLSIGQVSAFQNKLYDLLCMPHLGLSLGEQVRTSAFFPDKSELFLMHKPTYSTLLKLVKNKINSTFPAVSLGYFETENSVGLTIESYNSSVSSNRVTVETIMVNLYNQIALFLGDAIEPDFITFNYPKPAYSDIYDQYFSCDLRFNSHHSAFVVSRDMANTEIVFSEKNYTQIRELYLKGSNLPFKLSSLSKRFQYLLLNNKDEDSFPSLETSAHQLCVSPRTFRRHLKTLKTSYFDEIQTFKKNKAIDLLINSRNSISEIALMVDFCDASAFNNAFKKWTGKTPRQFKMNPKLS